MKAIIRKLNVTVGWHFKDSYFLYPGLTCILVDGLFRNEEPSHLLSTSQHLQIDSFEFYRMDGINWQDDEQRLKWEKELDAWRKRRVQWSWWQTFIWVWQIFILQLIIIIYLYGKFVLTLVFSLKFNFVKLMFSSQKSY